MPEESAPRRDPHEELDTLCARQPDKFVARETQQRFWIVDERAHAHEIKVLVDIARPRSIQLVRQTSRSHNDDSSVLWITFDRAANGATELEAARRRRQR